MAGRHCSGGDGDDALGGGGGSDRVVGVAGSDTMSGGAGDDPMEGNDDNDVMGGGTGNDTMYGLGERVRPDPLCRRSAAHDTLITFGADSGNEIIIEDTIDVAFGDIFFV